MKTKIFILFAIIVDAIHELPLQAQEQLPDTVWKKNISVGSLKFSQDGQYIYTTKDNNVLKIETFTSNILDTLILNRPLMKSLNISPTGDTLIVAGNGIIWLWETRTGESIEKLDYFGEDACFTPDGKRIVATTGKMGFDEPQILIIDIETKEIIKSFVGRYYGASNLQISPDGKYFSFNDFRGTYTTVVLIDLKTYEEIKIFEDPNKDYFVNMGFSPDNKMIGTASSDKMYLWDLKSLELIKTIKYYESQQVTDRGLGRRVFSSDLKYLIYGYFDWEDYDPNEIIVWDIDGDSLKYKYPWPANGSIDISKDDYIVACGRISYDRSKLYLLRPKWNETSVDEIKEDDYKYSINNGILRIYFADIPIYKPEIKIYNILGLSVETRHAVPLQQGNTIEMDLNYLPSGIYFVVVDVGGERRVVKILK
jgi:WD40 repeat protein